MSGRSRGVRIEPHALEALQTLAQMHDVSAEEYLDALLNYAWSQHRRPGSWEACSVFEYRNYDQRPSGPDALTGCADRWWSPLTK